MKGVFFHMKEVSSDFRLENHRIREKQNHQTQIHQGLDFEEMNIHTMPPKGFRYCQRTPDT